MLRILNPQSEKKGDQGTMLIKDLKNYTAWAPKEIVKVHNYLYRFSIERLKFLQRDKLVMKLFRYYYEIHAKERILGSKIMNKYSEAYFEAAEMILGINKQSDSSNHNHNIQINKNVDLGIGFSKVI